MQISIDFPWPFVGQTLSALFVFLYLYLPPWLRR